MTAALGCPRRSPDPSQGPSTRTSTFRLHKLPLTAGAQLIARNTSSFLPVSARVQLGPSACHKTSSFPASNLLPRHNLHIHHNTFLQDNPSNTKVCYMLYPITALASSLRVFCELHRVQRLAHSKFPSIYLLIFDHFHLITAQLIEIHHSLHNIPNTITLSPTTSSPSQSQGKPHYPPTPIQARATEFHHFKPCTSSSTSSNHLHNTLSLL